MKGLSQSSAAEVRAELHTLPDSRNLNNNKYEEAAVLTFYLVGLVLVDVLAQKVSQKANSKSSHFMNLGLRGGPQELVGYSVAFPVKAVRYVHKILETLCWRERLIFLLLLLPKKSLRSPHKEVHGRIVTS